MSNSRVNKNKQRRWIIISIIILILVIIRLILPRVILSYANKSLSGLKGYKGHIEDIDLSIIRGATTVHNFSLDKIDSTTHRQTPLLSFERANVSIDWRSLVKGKIVTESLIINPLVSFTKDRVEPKDIKKDTVDFRKLMNNLMPLKVNLFEVRNGKIEYHDSTTSPIVIVSVDKVYLIAKNLSNIEDTALLPASLHMDADVYGGRFNLNIKLDPLARNPTFDLNVELQNANLKALNDFFKAYAKIDINKGTFGLFAEIAAENRKFVGYVKPIIKDLEVVGPQDHKDSFLHKIWEGIVSVTASILKNPKKDQIATEIPISGEYEKGASVGIWYAVITVLRNAFIQALYPSIDFKINTGTVKELKKENEKSVLKNIMDKPKASDKKDKKKEEKKKEKEKEETKK